MLMMMLTTVLIGLATGAIGQDQALHDSLLTTDTHVDIFRIEEAQDKNDLTLPDVQVDLIKICFYQKSWS